MKNARTKKSADSPDVKKIRYSEPNKYTNKKDARMPKDTERVLITDNGALCLIVVISLIKMNGVITPNPAVKQVRHLPIIRRRKLLLKKTMIKPTICMTLVAIRAGFLPKNSAAG